MALNIVIDANIFVSSAFGGNPQKALCLAFAIGEIFITDKIKRELLNLPNRLSSKLNPEKQKILISLLKSFLHQTTEITPRIKINLCRDKKDNAYLEACLTAKADILLTGDKDLLEIGEKELLKINLPNLKILKPAEFLKRYSNFVQ